MQDARNFSYSSDYPMPLVTYRHEFTISAPSGQTAVLIKEEHGLPYAPLLLGKWSTSQDFTSAQDVSNAKDVDGTSLMIYSDDTYIYFLIFKLSNTDVTRYVRVVGFAPPDYNGDIQTIPNNSSYKFDSDNDYLELYAQGILNQSTGGYVEHSLGYTPQCRAWRWTNIYVVGKPIDFDAFEQIEPEIIQYKNSGRLEYYSVATDRKYIAYGRDIENDDYSLDAEDKIYYHIYTKEA